MSRSANALEKVRATLEEHFSAGRFYEAQQLYQSLYNRLCSKKQFAEAADLAKDGATRLLQHKQGNAGGQLAQLMISALKNASPLFESAHADLVLQVFAMFPEDSKEIAKSFMKDAIAWSCSELDPNGEPRLHLAMARALTEQKEHSGAQRHWLRAEKPEEHAAELGDWSLTGFAGERDLFLARAVLQYLALENLRDANVLLERFLSRVPLDTPLVNFTKFLLQTLERDALPLFELLRQKYAQSLARDPNLASYLDKIGEIYFGVKAPGGMLDDLLSSFMKGS